MAIVCFICGLCKFVYVCMCMCLYVCVCVCMHVCLSVCVGKGCIALCIENMQRVQELSPIELVEMFVTAFCFLKDSSEVSQVLLDDFRAANGYIFLTEFLLKFVHRLISILCSLYLSYMKSSSS